MDGESEVLCCHCRSMSYQRQQQTPMGSSPEDSVCKPASTIDNLCSMGGGGGTPILLSAGRDMVACRQADVPPSDESSQVL
eukprot:scaffold39557_cov59-Attheya_sp.AAC.3